MIVEYIRYELKAHTAYELISAYAEAAASLKPSPECLGYDLAQRDDEPNVLVLRIQWQSADAHMQSFRNGPNFPPFLALVRPFIGEIVEMKHYHLTNVSWQR
jgi:quinol monooxygenase YgiN